MALQCLQQRGIGVQAALSLRLVGADAETIGLGRGTVNGMSLLSRGLDWRDGDNVVVARGEDPADLAPWTALRGRGVEHRTVEPVGGRITPEAVLELVDARTRVVALGHVQPDSGCRTDVRRIGAELDRRGVLFAVDGSQSAGALRLDLAAMPVDFLAARASAWLLGPLGAGFCYCRPELLARLSPPAEAFQEASFSILDAAAFHQTLCRLIARLQDSHGAVRPGSGAPAGEARVRRGDRCGPSTSRRC